MGDFDFLEDIGKKLSDMANELGKMTEDTIEIQKKRSDIRSLSRGNERDYMDLGKAIYEKFTKAELTDPDMIALCEAIAKRDQQIEELKSEITKTRGGES